MWGQLEIEENTEMEPLPSAELLNAGHAFPCTFIFKVVGLSANDFLGRTLAAVQSEIGSTPTHSVRDTPGGRHTSVTLELPMNNAEHVLAVYRCLQPLDGLVLLL